MRLRLNKYRNTCRNLYSATRAELVEYNISAMVLPGIKCFSETQNSAYSFVFALFKKQGCVSISRDFIGIGFGFWRWDEHGAVICVYISLSGLHI